MIFKTTATSNNINGLNNVHALFWKLLESRLRLPHSIVYSVQAFPIRVLRKVAKLDSYKLIFPRIDYNAL